MNYVCHQMCMFGVQWRFQSIFIKDLHFIFFPLVKDCAFIHIEGLSLINIVLFAM